MSEPLLHIDDMEDATSAAYRATVGGHVKDLMVIKFDGAIYVYENNCPHIGAPLDFSPGEFLNYERNFIQCSTHGALFEIDSGVCVSGPCIAKRLVPVEHFVKDGHIYIE